jgi:hypothetical protein
MTNWSEGLLNDTFEVPIGTFAGFEERRDCKACQFVVQHFKTDPSCYPCRPSCCLTFSKILSNGRFWIQPVCLPPPLCFFASVTNNIRLFFVGKGLTTKSHAREPMGILSCYHRLHSIRRGSISFRLIRSGLTYKKFVSGPHTAMKTIMGCVTQCPSGAQLVQHLL